MQLENIIVDATAPGRLGRFWEQALSTRTLIDSEEEGFETRLDLPGGGFLDLCFQPVPHRPTERLRVVLDVAGGARQLEVAQRLRELGASDRGVGKGEVPWIVLGDVEGNPLCVMEHCEVYVDTGPIAA